MKETSRSRYDAVVVGAGPNGLVAAIELATRGASVLLIEAAETVGGGMKTSNLTLDGFLHDDCSAIHPMILGSPALRSLPLAGHGLEMVHPEVPLAHPLDGGSAVILDRAVGATSEGLGPDGAAYRRLMNPLVAHASDLTAQILGPLRIPRHPLTLARFGLKGLRPASWFVRSTFEGERARAITAGVAAHSMLALSSLPTAAFGLALLLFAHWVGWPLARGGSAAIARALEAHFNSLGGEIVTSTQIKSMAELPPHRAALFDVTPRQLDDIAGDVLPGRYRRALRRYRYGPGVFKVDWALDGPVPWKAPECLRAGTVHLGATFEEIAQSEDDVTKGRISERPFILIAQQSLFDGSRAPAGKHTLWGYCHVPSGSTVDMTDRIERQLERFAPGFRDRVLARHVRNAADMEAYNPNYIGGDINGGIQDLLQLYTRPAVRLSPYTTPNRSIYICSSSTPPGGGVHGMCGHWAARAALRRTLGIRA
jgi:phytoene dehydrogenase-like protein